MCGCSREKGFNKAMMMEAGRHCNLDCFPVCWNILSRHRRRVEDKSKQLSKGGKMMDDGSIKKSLVGLLIRIRRLRRGHDRSRCVTRIVRWWSKIPSPFPPTSIFFL